MILQGLLGFLCRYGWFVHRKWGLICRLCLENGV